MTLVPAALALLGHKSWWLPRQLDRALPDSTPKGRPCGRRPGRLQASFIRRRAEEARGQGGPIVIRHIDRGHLRE